MHTPDQFDIESPEKVYKKAENFSKTFTKKFDVPTSISKQSQLHELNQYNTNCIRYSIDREVYQKQLYKKLERRDRQKRASIEKKLISKDEVVGKNIDELRKKEEKSMEKINKHKSEVYKKYQQQQASKKHDKDDAAIKLRQQLNTFYEKEKQRKSDADAYQLKVATCYQNAVDRLDKIHHLNEDYALNSEKIHLARMERNSHKDRNLLDRSRYQSAQNAKKIQVYDKNEQIMDRNQWKFIQNYCKDLDLSLKAFQHKGKSKEKAKERIQAFFKKRVEQWRTLKTRVEAQKADNIQKFQDILEKKTQVTARRTVSSFRDSGKEWYNRVQANKSAIYDRNDREKDKLMRTHLNLSLRNNDIERINEKMTSMKGQAKKLAQEYL